MKPKNVHRGKTVKMINNFSSCNRVFERYFHRDKIPETKNKITETSKRIYKLSSVLEKPESCQRVWKVLYLLTNKPTN
jgi:hypothetical protein